MGERGRPAKPLELRVKQGNPGKRPIPQMTTVGSASGKAPPVPATLKAAGRKRWAQIWEAAAVWLGPSDAPAVELACTLEDDIAMLRRTMNGNKRQEMKLQWYWAVARAKKELLTAYSQLGLTPTARAKLGLVVAQAAETESRLTAFTRRAS